MKVLLKVGLLLVIVGAFLFGVFYVAGGSAQLPPSNDDYELVEQSYDPIYDNLVIDMDNKYIQLIEGETDQILVAYYVSEKDRVDVEDEGDTLEFINDVDRIFGWFFFGWSNWTISQEYRKFIVTVPAGWAPNLQIETSNGTISIGGHAAYGDIDLSSSNGAITLGDIDLIGEINIYTSNGTIELANLPSADLVKVRTSNGVVSIANVTAARLEATSSNGRITVNASSIAGLLKLKTSNGRIIVDQTEVVELEANTSNGDIDITLLGDENDFHIQMSTSLGKRYLNGLAVDDGSINPEQSRDLIASTSNGDVRVDFE